MSRLYTVAAPLGFELEEVDWQLVATTERLIICERITKKEVKVVELSQATKLENEILVGLGRLLVWYGERPETVLYYPLDYVPEYSLLANSLTKFLRDGLEPEFQAPPKQFCPSCARPLRRGSAVCPYCLNTGAVLKRLALILKPYRALVLLSMSVFLILTALDLIPPQIQRILVDQVLQVEQPSVKLLLVLVGIMALSRLLGTLFTILRGRVMVTVGARVGQDLRRMVFARLQALSLSFIDEHRTGDLMNRINHDTGHVQSFLQHQLPDLISQVLLLVGITAILIIQNWKLAFMILIPAPLMIWFSNKTRSRVRRMYHQQWRWWDQANSLLQDILSGIRVVKAFGNEKREASRFSEDSKKLRDITARNQMTWNTLYPTLSFIMGLGNFLILYYGGKLVLDHTFRIGELIQFSAYAGLIYRPLEFMSFIPRWFHQAMTAAERLFEIIDETPEIQDKPEPLSLPQLKGEIRLENVTFGYRPYEPVLKKVNLEIRPGELLGLVGHSGAGKSTLINLINRFYDVNEGAIYIDGIDVRELKQADFRQRVGVVLQESFLFAGTIWENIAYAKSDASAEDVIKAAKVANAHDFIVKFPDGYDTRVGERGQRLSGGERQRIAIARSILHNPRILIFDEATSSVDSETEQEIHQALQRLTADRTTIIIAHRLSTLRDAHRLAVLDQGELVEIGSHGELMELEGHYYRLVQAQRAIDEMDPQKIESFSAG